MDKKTRMQIVESVLQMPTEQATVIFDGFFFFFLFLHQLIHGSSINPHEHGRKELTREDK
jgi:hypothetical protein